MQIFISHVLEDRGLSERLTSALTDAGLKVWNPYSEIFPGDNWRKAVGRALEESDVMVVIFTPQVARSPTLLSALQSDVQYALTSGNYQGRVVPILAGFVNYEAGKDVPWVLLRMQPIEWQQPLQNEELDAAVKRVQEVAGHANAAG